MQILRRSLASLPQVPQVSKLVDDRWYDSDWKLMLFVFMVGLVVLSCANMISPGSGDFMRGYP